ncbi:MAG: delta-aminolevulinic acid dehydratase, partial [Bacteroidia bacterium]|nr:delta-aminolevulinic acid dehydratase [Bacteroidia bacterium]
MDSNFENSFSKLQQYVEEENYKGWDPYDGLNSKVFQSIPFVKNNRFFRLAWIQFFKKSPVNCRKLLLVPKGYNSKGIALFLSGYCRLYSIEPTEKN